MNATDPVRSILTIHDLLTDAYIPLSELAMREVGPASQSLGGLYKITGRETFVTIEKISLESRVPQSTCKKQLDRLHKAGWISKRGRERTRSGMLRRTATHALTAKGKLGKAPFLRLPYWSACKRGLWFKRLSWKARAVFACVSSTYNSLNDTEGLTEHADDPCEYILTECEDRFRYSLSRLEHKTGLDHKSITGAKRELTQAELIQWIGDRTTVGSGDGLTTDLLLPNINLSVVKSYWSSTDQFRLDLAK